MAGICLLPVFPSALTGLPRAVVLYWFVSASLRVLAPVHGHCSDCTTEQTHSHSV